MGPERDRQPVSRPSRSHPIHRSLPRPAGRSALRPGLAYLNLSGWTRAERWQTLRYAREKAVERLKRGRASLLTWDRKTDDVPMPEASCQPNGLRYVSPGQARNERGPGISRRKKWALKGTDNRCPGPPVVPPPGNLNPREPFFPNVCNVDLWVGKEPANPKRTFNFATIANQDHV